jgi:hypothetical protein
MNGLFRILRKAWMERYSETSTALAKHLSALTGRKIRPPLVANWANGTGGAIPQWPVILILCQELGLEVRLSPHDAGFQVYEEE